MTFEDIKKVNESIATTDIKGKAYAEVNERIKAFRMLYPEGTIATEMISNVDGVCIFKASVYSNSNPTVNSLLGTGHAYEKEGSNFINATSYIENCETSAVGRALAMCGLGIDVAIRSAEEVANAERNQAQVKVDALDNAQARTEVLKLCNKSSEKFVKSILEHYNVESIQYLNTEQCKEVLAKAQEMKK